MLSVGAGFYDRAFPLFYWYYKAALKFRQAVFLVLDKKTIIL